MTRESQQTDLIAILATGDEIKNGDILNTNAQEIAYRLFNQGFLVGNHMTVGDRIDDIEDAIRFLLKSHRGLIITGGLGPTSDDLTRFALANALHQELIFNEDVWQTIVSRLQKLGYKEPPENNRQQALFPEDAITIPNPNGTAAGCTLQNDDQWIFMLPGPPLECLPMFEKAVVPTLIENQFQKQFFHQKWLLFGVSEGELAEKLDALAKPFNVITGYRLWYPYLEFKIYSDQYDDYIALLPYIEQAISPFLIGDGKKTASEILKDKIIELKLKMSIKDEATGGSLEAILKTPQTFPFLNFDMNDKMEYSILVRGLSEFWHSENTMKTSLEITLKNNEVTKQKIYEIPCRGIRVKQFAVEFICRKIYKHFLTDKKHQ